MRGWSPLNLRLIENHITKTRFTSVRGLKESSGPYWDWKPIDKRFIWWTNSFYGCVKTRSLEDIIAHTLLKMAATNGSYVVPELYHSQITRPIKIINIGCGFSGLCLAYKMMKEMESFELTIYEKNKDIGGTSASLNLILRWSWTNITLAGLRTDILAVPVMFLLISIVCRPSCCYEFKFC